jgi:hypothetical protein
VNVRDMNWMQVETYLDRDDRCAAMRRIWEVAVEETRALLEVPWGA